MLWLFAIPMDLLAMGQSDQVPFNEGFEQSLDGWQVAPTNSSVIEPYSSGTIGFSVRDAIGGQANLLRSGASSGSLERSIDLGSDYLGKNLVVGGHFGGAGGSNVCYQLQATFLSLGGSVLGTPEVVPLVTYYTRNHESVLMRRERILTIPQGASKIRVRLQIVQDVSNSGGFDAFVDNVYAVLTSDPVIPEPKQIGAELVHNSELEATWSNNDSPLDLNDPAGWEGGGPNEVLFSSYGGQDVPYSPATLPSIPLANKIGGGAKFVRNNFSFGSSGLTECSLRQVIDLRGNAQLPSKFQGQVLHVSGYLGGTANGPGTASLSAKFLGAGGVLLSNPEVALMTRARRNVESILLKCEDYLPIPEATQFVEVRIDFHNAYWGGWGNLADSWVDRISARLASEPSLSETKLKKNLIKNGSFENESLNPGSVSAWPGSPLSPNITDGWIGNSGDQRSYVLPHGGQLYQSTASSAAYAAANGLGSRLLAAQVEDNGSYASIKQVIDVESLSLAIEAGGVTAKVSGWLGIAKSSAHVAELFARQLKSDGTLVPGVTDILVGSVKYSDLPPGIAMLRHSVDFPLDKKTRKLEIVIRLSSGVNYENYGFVDDVRLELESSVDPDDLGPQNCDKAKVEAVGNYSNHIIGLGADFVALDPADQDPSELQKMKKKAGKKLKTDFEYAEHAASIVGGSCTSTAASATLEASSLGATDQVYAKLTASVNMNSKKDRKLRSKILDLAAVFYLSAAKAEAQNIKAPNRQKLEKKRQKARSTFLDASIVEIEKAALKGVDYPGASADLASVISLIDGDVDLMAGALH